MGTNIDISIYLWPLIQNKFYYKFWGIYKHLYPKLDFLDKEQKEEDILKQKRNHISLDLESIHFDNTSRGINICMIFYWKIEVKGNWW